MLPPPGRFAEDIRAYEQEPLPPPNRVVVFYGSSSIHLWQHLDREFPNIEPRNRGFGGSTLVEAIDHFGQLVLPLKPRALVIYSGENDIAEFAANAEEVRDRLVTLVGLIQRDLPGRPFAVLSIKPSPMRAEFLSTMRRANGLIREALAPIPQASFIDIVPLMLDAAGQPRADLYSDDGYHMNVEGYRLWREALSPWLAKL